MSTLTPASARNSDDDEIRFDGHDAALGFRERFRFARVRANKKLKDIAEFTGYAEGTLSTWSREKNPRSPAVGDERLEKLAYFLDCDLGWLLTGDGNGPGKYRGDYRPGDVR
jgi:transcriptional regulator with XRE-family HTH domain